MAYNEDSAAVHDMSVCATLKITPKWTNGQDCRFNCVRLSSQEENLYYWSSIIYTVSQHLTHFREQVTKET